ncbi:hypothetical protein JZ751_025893 [Albula glossodonta]|uniref:Uncharacterized protein n=1 Tax=Albula glossodonta TaxID=121402 RepID=A0A8T2NEZ6_9TELE|nr:hypothetical protein JZ751_025893 [Albula glossodonta]
MRASACWRKAVRMGGRGEGAGHRRREIKPRSPVMSPRRLRFSGVWLQPWGVTTRDVLCAEYYGMLLLGTLSAGSVGPTGAPISDKDDVITPSVNVFDETPLYAQSSLPLIPPTTKTHPNPPPEPIHPATHLATLTESWGGWGGKSNDRNISWVCPEGSWRAEECFFKLFKMAAGSQTATSSAKTVSVYLKISSIPWVSAWVEHTLRVIVSQREADGHNGSYQHKLDQQAKHLPGEHRLCFPTVKVSPTDLRQFAEKCCTFGIINAEKMFPMYSTDMDGSPMREQLQSPVLSVPLCTNKPQEQQQWPFNLLTFDPVFLTNHSQGHSLQPKGRVSLPCRFTSSERCVRAAFRPCFLKPRIIPRVTQRES